MQTIEIQVKDGYASNVLQMLESLKDVVIEKIELKKDPMLEMDPYFYERKKHVAKTIEAIESGEMELIDAESFNDEMDRFEQELVLKYGN